MSEQRKASLLDEASRARALLAEHPEIVNRDRNLVSTTILAQTLFALWDSGFYEHVLSAGAVSLADAKTLGYDDTVFEVILRYLVGRGVLRPDATSFVLTDYGRELHNVFTRGLIRLYVGGYSPLLSQLGPLLRGELSLADRCVKRLARAVASGTEDINCVHTVPAVMKVLRREQARCVLDLGCGTGGFLIQLAELEPELSGIGIDLEQEAIDGARENAERRGVASRLKFHRAAVGPAALDVAPELLARVDTVCCMFLLHEFGRGGEAAIEETVRAIAHQLPGRRLIVLESDPVDHPGGDHPAPAHFGHLDYWYVHPLSLQGSPMPAEKWRSLFLRAGARAVEHHATFPSSIARIYQIQL